VTGTSVLGLTYKGGVMIASDTLGRASPLLLWLTCGLRFTPQRTKKSLYKHHFVDCQGVTDQQRGTSLLSDCARLTAKQSLGQEESCQTSSTL